MATASASSIQPSVSASGGADDSRRLDPERHVAVGLRAVRVERDDRIPVGDRLKIEPVFEADLSRIKNLGHGQTERAVGLRIVDVAVQLVARRARYRVPGEAHSLGRRGLGEPEPGRSRVGGHPSPRSRARSSNRRRLRQRSREPSPRLIRLDDQRHARQARRLADLIEILGGRVHCPEQRPGQRKERKRDDNVERDQRAPVFLEPPPRILPVRDRGARERLGPPFNGDPLEIAGSEVERSRAHSSLTLGSMSP